MKIVSNVGTYQTTDDSSQNADARPLRQGDFKSDWTLTIHSFTRAKVEPKIVQR